MKRESYSIHRVKSARYGIYLTLSDQLHELLVIRADTTPGISEYSVYSPTFTYVVRGREREGQFPVAARFNDDHVEFWSSTWERTPDLGSSIHLAQAAHAVHMGATHHLYTLEELETNWTLLKNRSTMQSILGAGYATSTTHVESGVLAALHKKSSQMLVVLAAEIGASLAMTQLAVFRLVVGGLIDSELETRLICPDWQVRRRDHAHA